MIECNLAMTLYDLASIGGVFDLYTHNWPFCYHDINPYYDTVSTSPYIKVNQKPVMFQDTGNKKLRCHTRESNPRFTPAIRATRNRLWRAVFTTYILTCYMIGTGPILIIRVSTISDCAPYAPRDAFIPQIRMLRLCYSHRPRRRWLHPRE